MLFGASKSTNKEQNIAHPKPKEKLTYPYLLFFFHEVFHFFPNGLIFYFQKNSLFWFKFEFFL